MKDKLREGFENVMAKHAVPFFEVYDPTDGNIVVIKTPTKLPAEALDEIRALVPSEFGLKYEIMDEDFKFEKLSPIKGDAVAHPSHYNQGKIEVIEFIEDQRLGYHLGNTVKYLCRAGKKDPSKTIEDLKKGRWYLDRRIEQLEAEKEGREALRPNDMVKR